MKFLDLTGKSFGRLIVLGLSSKKDKTNRRYWYCQCSCGNLCCIKGDNLRCNRTKSCGCIKIEQNKTQAKNLIKGSIGSIYGRLTILEKSEKGKWLCKCECGNLRYVDAHSLYRGNTKSCGCLNREISSKNLIERNKKNSGILSPNYKHNLSEEYRSKMRLPRRELFPNYNSWVFSILSKYKFTCLVCNKKDSGNLIAHHLYSFNDYPDLRFNLNNGVCLCKLCHKIFHKEFGYKHSTKEKFIEFLTSHSLINKIESIDNYHAL